MIYAPFAICKNADCGKPFRRPASEPDAVLCEYCRPSEVTTYIPPVRKEDKDALQNLPTLQESF